MNKKFSICVLCLVLSVFFIFVTGCSKEQDSIIYPTKTIELVVPWSAGGGSDRFGRAITQVIKDENLLPEPVVVVNKPGANGMIAANFVGNKPDDTHTLITNVTGDIGAWISSKSKDVSIDKFKPVAMLAWDEYVLMVKSDSPFNTLGDLINYSKEHPDEVTFAGTGIGTVEHMLHETLITETDAQVEYVPYEGGGEIMSALLGGHITANWANPGEAEAQIEAGTLKALAVASENRLDFLPDIPTAKEQGYDIVIRQYRGVLAPKNMPDEYLNILVNVLRKVSESDVFKEYAKNNSLTVEFKAFDDFKQEIDKVHETVINIFK